MSVLSMRRAVLATGVAATLALTGTAAFADTISNTVDNTVDTTIEVMSLTAGTTGSTSYVVQGAAMDGDNGCNLKNTQYVVLSVQSSNTSVAAVSPSSVRIENCDTASSPITVTGVASGSATVTVSVAETDSPGAFITSTATFRVDVAAAAPTNTAPSVTVTGFEDGDTYELGVDTLPTPGCAVTDAEDGPSTPAPSVQDDRDAHGLGSVTVTCSYTDGGGLSDEVSATYTVGDTLDPQVTNLTRHPAANAQGWNNSDVIVSWDCTDLGSGVVSTSGAETVSAEGADQSVVATCTDHAGNTASDTVNGINIDTTAPAVTWSAGAIAAGASYYFGDVPAAPTCSATDLLSGLAAPCAVTGYGTTVGQHTLSASATDKADNTTTSTRTYTVQAWTLAGYDKPVDTGDVWNVVKNGSTVPLKFEAYKGDTEITDVATLGATFTVKGVTCPGASAATDDVELTTTGGTTFRYDTTGGQFVQNWQTPKKAGSCYRVVTTTADGSTLEANFKLK